ncbi:hypothetical protein FJZ33_09950 [Candidatus Poribacteria bacterium]|nr:hypothetical protein [Candidatus Poribacteria bacterium]
MLKTIRGVYENGKIQISKEDLPKIKGKIGVIVVFLETENDERELEMEVPFSIADSGFFSLLPEHLGKTSAKDIDEIIAKEAIGQE